MLQIDRGSIKRPLNDNNRGKKRLKVPDEDMELGNSGGIVYLLCNVFNYDVIRVIKM